MVGRDREQQEGLERVREGRRRCKKGYRVG